MAEHDIFDRSARRHRRKQLYQAKFEDRWLVNCVATELAERWISFGSQSGKALLVGFESGIIEAALKEGACFVVRSDPGFGWPHQPYSFICDEDRQPFRDASFDTIFSTLTLDSLTDVPGALHLIRRMLKPGGRFLGAMWGVGSLQMLRELTVVEGIDFPTVSRFHPLVDVRAAGDLLARAGFVQAVADADSIKARYTNLGRLLDDMRSNGLRNCLVHRLRLNSTEFQRWSEKFDEQNASLGGVVEQFCPVYLSAMAP